MIHKSFATEEIIAAIDLGSSHCITLIASVNPDGTLKIIGDGTVPTRGVQHGTIIALSEATDTIEQSLTKAERFCGKNINSVYLNVSGHHILSQNDKGEIAIESPEENITDSDIERAIEFARTTALPANREILNLVVRYFKIDDQPQNIPDPLGMTGTKLEANVHLITANTSILRNFEKALGNIGLGKEAFVFSGYAASEVVLSAAEKEAGVICIDIGSDITNYCVYLEGALTLSGVIPIGGRYVSQDIGQYLKVSLETAEKIKIGLANLPPITPRQPEESPKDFRQRQKEADLLRVGDFEPGQTATASKNFLVNTVIHARLKEILDMIDNDLRTHKLANKLAAGAVLVGGGAKTVNVAPIAERVLRMRARVGVPQAMDGVVKNTTDPSYATAVGLLNFAAKERSVEITETVKNSDKTNGLDNWFSKWGHKIKNFMP
ncbi:cell division protein FtsA [bacterium]|nr:cell division protein FtsA [bacterium]